MNRSITTVVSVAFVGGMLGRGLRYLLNVVIARGLGAEALGTFAFGMVVLKLLSVFSRLGLDNVGLKYIPQYRERGSSGHIFGLTLVGIGFPLLTGGVAALGVTMAAPFLSPFFDPKLLETLPLFALGIPLFSAMFVGMAITRGYNESKYAVYTRDIGQSVAAVTLAAVGSFLLVDFSAVVLGYVASMVVGLVLVVWFLRRKRALRFDVSPQFELREWFVFSTPTLLIAVTHYLLSWTDVLMLSAFVSATEVGWYQAAYQTSVLLLVMLHASNSIFPSLVSGLYERDEYDRLEEMYVAITKWIVYLTALGGSFIFIYRSEVLLLFGDVAQVGKTALVILLVGQFLVTSVGETGFLLIMSDNERLDLLTTVAGVLLNIVLNYVLIQRFGIVGAAMATTISLGLLNVAQLSEVYLILDMTPFSTAYWRGAVGVVVGIVILLLGQYVPLFPFGKALVAGFFALAGFVVTMFVLGFDEYDTLLVESF